MAKKVWNHTDVVNAEDANRWEDKLTEIEVTTSLNTLNSSLTSEIGKKEDAFIKNTAFNKNYGSIAGTTTQGNDPRLSDARVPIAHTHIKNQITDFDVAADARVNLLKGNPPDTLNTLEKVANALGNDPQSITTLSEKVRLLGDPTISSFHLFALSGRTKSFIVNGVVDTFKLTVSGLNVTTQGGLAVVFGREIYFDALDNLTCKVLASSNGYVVLTIDISDPKNTKVTFQQKNTLVQQDFRLGGTIYDMPLMTYTSNTTTITASVDKRNLVTNSESQVQIMRYGTQSIPSNTTTLVSVSNNVGELANIGSFKQAGGRVTCLFDGFIEVNANIVLIHTDNTSNKSSFTYLYKNGVVMNPFRSMVETSSRVFPLFISAIVPVLSGDIVDIRVNTTSPSTIQVENSYMTVKKLG